MSIPAMPMQMTAAGSVAVAVAIVNQIYCVRIDNIKTILDGLKTSLHWYDMMYWRKKLSDNWWGILCLEDCLVSLLYSIVSYDDVEVELLASQRGGIRNWPTTNDFHN